MTPNSGACSSRRTRKPLRASASEMDAPPSPPPTTKIGSLLRVTAAPRIRFQANPLAIKGESRAFGTAQRCFGAVTKMTQRRFAESKSSDLRITDSEDYGIQRSRERSIRPGPSGRDADPLDFPFQLDAGTFFYPPPHGFAQGFDVGCGG